MRVFIAEKPSLARALAEALPKPHRKGDGFIEASNGDIVTWCIGHLLQQAEPEVYDLKYKKWVAEHLPIIPLEWKLVPKPKTKKQLAIIKKLIKKSTSLVNAGDVDREGQILIDEVISYCGATKTKIANAKRCLISDMNLAAVKKSINNLKPNKDYIPLATSALARARADWLYGINMTRLCTLQGQKSGYQGVLSIGRVQTPILGLVVNRDLEIQNFVSKPFYEVIAEIQTNSGIQYKGKWKPSEECQPYMDEENRVLSKELALKVIERINNQPGKIVKFEQSKKQQPAPLLFSLSALQIAAAKAYGMSAKQVLDVCQQLYERHKLITYPRSDCQYLPKEHFNDVHAVAKAMGSISDKAQTMLQKANLQQKSRVWNDNKVGAHHAIVPTARGQISGKLSIDEIKIYNLVARQYIAQFYPPFEYADKIIETKISGGLFVSREKSIINNGWKDLFASPSKNKEQNEFSKISLPDVRVADIVQCLSGSLLEKNTTPPKHFNDATLLSALTGIARYVTDPDIKKALRDTDGLGTEATRAGIIELLFKRDFLARRSKDIYATDIGIKLITTLPNQISKPDMTALWESQLESISTKSLNYKTFIGGVETNLGHLINEVKSLNFTGLPKKSNSSFTTKPKRFRKKSVSKTKKSSVKR